MSIFSKPKEKDELMLVFNIGSSSVGGALFFIQKSGTPKIIFSVTEPIPLEEKTDIERLQSLTIQTLEIVSHKVYQAHLGAPSQTFCVLSSPWYASQTRMINLKKNTPFVFTAKLADELVQKEIKIFKEENLAKYGPLARVIELKNIKTMLNGYETGNPLNQKAQELQMTVFISVSGEQFLKKVEDTISQHFHFKLIKFSSLAMASFAVLRDIHPEQESFILVDIGGEVTDIFMIKKSILRESISFPLGRNFLTRGVASGLGATLDEANSIISLLKDGHAEDSLAKKIMPITGQLKETWLKSFQESLSNISGDISIPSVIYITIDKEIADLFSETIKTEQFNQYSLTESKFEVIFLDTQMLHGLAVFEESVVRDSGLVVDSIYISRFLANR
ncbi:cell division FtsA domain-containing protein [Candidatus Nomurabacteria bacterium]|nr:cell division FtsA domain-containing protein [Candidatus Nomurabacteria bacterium]